MTTINTSLYCLPAVRDGGELTFSPTASFGDISTLALVMGMIDPDTRRLPTDEDGLRAVAYQLEYTLCDCLSGLQGIGELLAAVGLEGVKQEGVNALGRLVANLATMADEMLDHQKQLSFDPRFHERRT